MTDENVPWPKPGAVLFGSADDWRSNACINFDPDAWRGYAEGFRIGADLLVQHVIDTSRDQDYLVYPIVFSYRHAVELHLKLLYRESRRLLGEDPSVPIGHRLDKLWRKTRKALERAIPGEGAAEIAAVDESIRQLAEADPPSTGFRYPVDQSGAPSLEHLGLHINLRRLRHGVADVLAFLDAATSEVQRRIELKDEERYWQE